MFNGKADLDKSIRRELVRIILERIQGEGIEDAAGSLQYDPDNIPGSKDRSVYVQLFQTDERNLSGQTYTKRSKHT